ncbi:MAG: TIGR02680 family protein [Tepidanaerobacteraceae bacterium]|nr:TIGR02680 family protein [Tepidanaerobacteraceae bacterium]
MKSRWMLSRAGLINFWYYDDEEFDFSGGRLLLRGANGSGKSVTMQSFIPLLLDGNKSPERLDPFGSRARRLEDYLLGEESVSGVDERTGYLYMEFKRQNAESYMTVGLGLKARRGQSLDSWGFIILDGRRVGRDLHLYKWEIGADGKKQKVPLSKRELKAKIVPGGEVTESQREYMEMVNKYIFGFNTVEEYDELIKLLVQLRSPKLSKDFRPTVIYEIMNAALPALSDEDLRPLSETIENMDEIKAHLDELYKSRGAAARLKAEYDSYNRFILYEKSKALAKSYQDLSEAVKNRDTLANEIESQKRLEEELAAKIGALQAEQAALKQKEESLRENDAFKAGQALAKEEQQLKDRKAALEKKRCQLNEKNSRKKELERQIGDAAREKEAVELAMRETMADMDKAAGASDFMEHAFSKDELQKVFGRKFDFTFWKNEVSKHKNKIKKALEAMQKEREENRRYDRALQEQDVLRKERDDCLRRLKEWEAQFDTVKGEYVEKIYAWSDANGELKIQRDSLEALARLALNYGDRIGFEDILKEVRAFFENKNRQLLDSKISLQNRRAQEVNLLDEKKAELEEWKNKKDPEPERHPQVEQNRKRLRESGIPHVPLYMALEFKEDVDEEARGRLEAALEDMGLLDALIVPKEYLDRAMAMDGGMCDRFIAPGRFSMSLNVLQYFDVAGLEGVSVSRETVDDALRNILAYREENATYVEDGGFFGIGVLKGKGRGGERPRYIGYESRKRFREDKIAALNREIEEINGRVQSMDEQIEILGERIAQLKQEYDAFPGPQDMDAALASCRDAERELKNAEKALESKNQEVNTLFDLLQNLRAEVRKLTSGINIRADIKSYEEAMDNMDEYGENLGRLEIAYSKMLSAAEKVSILTQNYEDARADADDLAAEIRDIEAAISESLARIKALNETIETLGLAKLEEEMRGCIRRLEEIPAKIREADNLATATATRRQNNMEKLAELDKKIELISGICSIYKKGFLDEWKLRFVKDLGDLPESAGDDEISGFCRKIVKALGAFAERPGLDREKIARDLQEAFYMNQVELLNYGLAMGYLFEDASIPEESPAGGETSDEERTDALRHAAAKLRRFQITANLQGKTVSLYTLYDTIEQDIAANEALLRETDRKLFEEIILHNVGKKIRARIFRAEEWVKDMNRLMSERDTSSGITFSLQWKPVPAESEEEMDTRQLVEILKSGAQMLKPEEFNLVTRHFRSKVDRARKVMDNADNTETFHHIIKDILDYRKWFEFKLYFRKEGETRRELTNYAFDKLSGGEKAMAMYIPLFSAVCARYNSAAQDAPRVISLDEAFAGVDDINIRDMFGLMEDLNFNFIINSQVLWGDYDTVPELSICELVRPKNAGFVTVIRYIWDGKKRMLKYDVDEDAAQAAGSGK